MPDKARDAGSGETKPAVSSPAPTSSLPSVRTFVRLPSVNEFPIDPLMSWLQLLAANQKILDDKLTLLLQELE